MSIFLDRCLHIENVFFSECSRYNIEYLDSLFDQFVVILVDMFLFMHHYLIMHQYTAVKIVELSMSNMLERNGYLY